MEPVKNESDFDQYLMFGNTSEAAKAISRWSEGYNNDFQARMDWSIRNDFTQANHHPVAVLNGDTTRRTLQLNAKPNDKVELTADGSSDPDGNELTYSWTFYSEPSDYEKLVAIDTKATSATVSIPKDASGKRLHIILEVRDNGEPNLIAYRRLLSRWNEQMIANQTLYHQFRHWYNSEVHIFPPGI